MNGISSSAKEAIERAVEDVFDRMSNEFVGYYPGYEGSKNLIMSFGSDNGLASLFVQAMGNRVPTAVEKDVLAGLLQTANGYIKGLKETSKANIADQIDSLARTAKLRGEKLKPSDVEEVLNEEFKKIRAKMLAIAEAESTKVRNMGSLVDIAKVGASVGEPDPACFFVVMRDSSTCQECIRLHLMPDQVTPRLWKLSELKSGYHKRGENTPSIAGLHPHCFTENQRIATDKGLLTFKELFDSQEAPNVLVDYRIKNRMYPGNQFGKPVPGQVWHHSHSTQKGRFLPATPVYETGVQEVIRFTFDTGNQLEVTRGHEMWVETGNTKWEKVHASSLVVGDKVPVAARTEVFGQDHFPLEAELMGNLLGDGSITKKGHAQWHFFGNDIPYGVELYQKVKSAYPDWHQTDTLTVNPPNLKYKVEQATFASETVGKLLQNEFGLSKKPRRVPARLFRADKETVSAFLRGLIAADGHTELNSLVIAQNDKEFLREIQLLLSMFGLVSRILDHGEAMEKIITYADGTQYPTSRKAAWRLQCGGFNQFKKISEDIGFGVPAKSEKARSNLKPHEASRSSWVTAKITKIEEIGLQQTYCLTEPMTNTVSVNGIVTGQCRCSLTMLGKSFTFNSKGLIAYKAQGHDEYEVQRSKK